MSADNDEANEAKATISLTDDDIKVVRQRERRSFLKSVGLSVIGIAAFAAVPKATAADQDPSDGRDSDTSDNGNGTTTHHDFPKKSNDDDETTNADLKAVDSDDRNSKEVDGDQSHLRDVKGSSDSD